MRLVASYHPAYDENELIRRWSIIHEWYERATTPIEKGGMSRRSVGAVALTAFACSIAASLKHIGLTLTKMVR